MAVVPTEIDDDTFRELLDSEVPVLGNYLIGFSLPRVADEHLDAPPGGSGTLVSICGIEGILTAKHVLDGLAQNKVVGLVLPSQKPKDLHNVSFEFEHCSHVTLPSEAKPTPHGPDLGFLVPPPDTLGTLRSKMSFYNLSKPAAVILEKPASIELGIWALSGFPGEWTEDGTPERGFERVKVFRGGFGEGKVTRELVEGEYDYLFFEALYNNLYEGPQSFQGMSGGGLWQLLGRVDDGKVNITHRLLSGVAFYQSDLMKAGEMITREIRCHGRRSLYGALVEKVRRQLIS